jgi:hypothetical protein
MQRIRREADVALNGWLVLAATCAVGIVGLLLAASDSAGSASCVGFGLFLVAVAYAFVLIKRHFDRVDQLRH